MFRAYVGLDARTNDEMRAECHLIVNSLSSSRKQTAAALPQVYNRFHKYLSKICGQPSLTMPEKFSTGCSRRITSACENDGASEEALYSPALSVAPQRTAILGGSAARAIVSRCLNPQHSIQHRPRILPWTTATIRPSSRAQERFNQPPFDIAEFPSFSDALILHFLYIENTFPRFMPNHFPAWP
jgi:hypothetical protein